MSADVIYTMYRADKFYGPERQVLQNISLSFLHGAKIGVLGPNGAGKSTLLRIMAGLEEPSSGVAELDPKASVGFLPQEPELDPEKDVRANVEDGVRELRELLDRFQAISAAFAEPDADFDALLAEQADVQERIDRADAWSLDQTLDRAMDALRLPGPRRESRRCPAASGGASRCAACCSRRRTCCSSTSPRTTSTPSRSRGSSGTWRPTRAPSSRSPTTATSSTTSPGGSSSSTAARGCRSRATTRPGSSRRRRGSPSRRSRAPPAGARCSASSSGCA